MQISHQRKSAEELERRRQSEFAGQKRASEEAQRESGSDEPNPSEHDEHGSAHL